MKKKINVYILIVLVALLLIVKGPSWFKTGGSFIGGETFRDTNHLILTKHVKCRMDCRNITIDEIKHVLKTGYVNNSKSGIGSRGDSTFALDGYSADKQHIRVVVAPETAGLVVVTCIDLNKEWFCECD